MHKAIVPTHDSGFGGLEVACWPLVLEFAGSHPAEAVGFFGRKNPQHAFLRRFDVTLRHVKEPKSDVEAAIFGQILGHFLPIVPPSATRAGLWRELERSNHWSYKLGV
jgi:hypothetical protein